MTEGDPAGVGSHASRNQFNTLWLTYLRLKRRAIRANSRLPWADRIVLDDLPSDAQLLGEAAPAPASPAILTVEAWNASHPVGTEVTITDPDLGLVRARTRSPAWLLADNVPAIKLEGIRGAFTLDRVAIAAPDPPLPDPSPSPDRSGADHAHEDARDPDQAQALARGQAGDGRPEEVGAGQAVGPEEAR